MFCLKSIQDSTSGRQWFQIRFLEWRSMGPSHLFRRMQPMALPSPMELLAQERGRGGEGLREEEKWG